MFRRPRRTTGRRSHTISVLLALAVMSAMLSPLGPTGSEKAEAATVPIGAIQANVSNHHGTDGGNDSSNCVRYSPTGAADASGFVGSASEALTSHGYSNSCPGTLSTSTQSAVGVKPATTASVQDGVPFLLARVTHYNNPVTVVAAHFSGAFTIRMGGFDTTPDLTYGWSMWETPNNANPCAFTGPGVPNADGCADQIVFTGQVPDQTLTKNGITYKLVMKGFSPSNGTCPATQPANTQTQFLTGEKANSVACVYASLVQVRSLTIVKRIVAPAGITPPTTAFTFDGASEIGGSAWDNNNFSLTPSLASSASFGPRELLQGDTVSVTERAPTSSKWALTSVSCVDGVGTAVAATVNLAARSMTLPDVEAPATVGAGPITCTYTNTYTPQAKLTLVKAVDGGTALPSRWTLSAGGPTPISGVSGSAAVTAQSVNAGSYTLDEAGAPLGYTSQGWSCTGGTLSGSRLTLVDNDNATCTITNRFSRSTFRIVKQVQGPAGGFTGSGTTAFTGSWSCGGTTGSFSVTQNTPYVSPDIPSGTTCTVTETQPTGNLANSSWSWNAPTYPDGNSVVIADGSVPTVTVRNTFAQATGSLTLAKVVQPRPGAPLAGYTGGDRTFPIGYTCQIGGNTVASGTVQVANGASSTVTGLPATAVCALSETLTSQAGDFADPSLAWDGHSISSASVTIVANAGRSSTVTNFFTKQTASLTIGKQIAGAGYTGGTAEHFTVRWDCGTASGTVTLARDAAKTVTVPANTGCTVTEVDPAGNLDPAHDWGAPTYAGLTSGVVNVPPGGTATVTVTNHTVPVYGRVSVTKALTGATEGVRARTTFPITVTCDNPARGTVDDYTDTFDLTVNETGTTPELPVGTGCTVTEGALPGTGLVDDSYAWGPHPAAQDVLVSTSNQTTPVTVTNHVNRAFGSLGITKTVAPLNGVDGAGTTFTGTWSCTTADETKSGTWSRTGSGPATLTGGADQILLTSTCSVTENDPTTPPSAGDPSYAWGAKTLSAPVVLTSAEPSGTLTVGNQVIRVTGTFSVTKSVEGGEAGTAFVDGDFTFSYSCSGDLLPRAIDGTVTVRAGQTTQVGTSIPNGSTCTISETGRPAPITPYDWDDVTIAPTSFTISATTPVAVHATNTISQRTVTATLRKVVDDPDGGFVGNPDFEVSLVCVLDGNRTTYGPEPVKANGTVSFDGILVGSACAPVEAPIDAGDGLRDASFTWGLPTFSEEQEIRDLQGTYAFTIVNHVERAYGNLTLEKVLDDPDHVVDPGRTYSGTWSCTRDGDAPVSGTWTVDGAGPATLAGVPATGILLDSTCAPEEAALTSPPSASDPSYSWKDPTFTPGTTSAESTASMTVTNSVTRSTVDLRVRKAVTGATEGYPGTGADFRVGYTCYLDDPADGISDNVDVVAGAPSVVLASGIPAGWTCHVVEQAPAQDLLQDRSYAWDTPTIDGLDADGNVTVTGDQTLTVTNPVVRRTGSFSVVKQLGPTTPDGSVDADAPFSGTYTCRYAGDVVREGTWSVTGTGAATLTPAADGLPASTVCSATEDPPDDSGLADSGWTWATPEVSDPVTVEALDDPAEVTVTNTPTRVYAPFSIAKVYEGPDSALVTGADVVGAWSCDYQGVQVDAGRWRLPAAGGSVAIAAADGRLPGENGPIRLPASSTCTVVEDSPLTTALVDDSYAWDAPTYDPADGTVTLVTTADNEVTVTNSVSRVYGSFEITKAIDLAAEHTPGLEFTGTWTCTHAGDPAATGTWRIAGTGTDTFSGVLVGSQCEVSEDEPSQPPSTDPSYAWAGHPVSPENITVTSGGTPARLVVTNETVRQLAPLRISKVLLGDTAGEPDDQTYDMSYSCLDGSGVTHSDSRSISAGQSWTTARVIPLGSECTVSEGDLPDVSPRDVWGPVTFTVTVDVDGQATRVPDQLTRAQSHSFVVPAAEDNQILNVAVTNTLIRQEAGYLVAKTSDPPSGTTLDPGDPVTYTITVTPTGPGSTSDVVVTDDLSQVTPYATVAVGDASQGSASLNGDTLTWDVGAVSGTTPRTLTYTATVSDAAYGAVLRNHVTATGDLPPTECQPCDTEHPVTPLWTLEKSADPPSGTTVQPDSEITYTLEATNRSIATPLPAGTVVTDDLTDVLDHASFVGFVGSTPGSALRSGNTLTWTLPEVPAHTSVLLRYTVHVDPGAFGVELRNVVTGRGVTPPSTDCTDPSGTRLGRSLAAVSPATCVTSTEHDTAAESETLAPTTPGSESVSAAETGVGGADSVLGDTGAAPMLGWLAATGAAMLVAGLALLLQARRRRS